MEPMDIDEDFFEPRVAEAISSLMGAVITLNGIAVKQAPGRVAGPLWPRCSSWRSSRPCPLSCARVWAPLSPASTGSLRAGRTAAGGGDGGPARGDSRGRAAAR